MHIFNISVLDKKKTESCRRYVLKTIELLDTYDGILYNKLL